jgi:hypothetical protein
MPALPAMPMDHWFARVCAAAPALAVMAACAMGGDALAESERMQALGAAPDVTIKSYGPNAVSVWNEIAFATTQVPPSPAGATPSERVAGPDVATVQLAVYDAVIAIAGTHQPYAIKPSTPTAGASMDAAAIEAAYRVLKGLFPSRGDKYEAAYASGIGALPDGDAKVRGMAIGAEVAAGMLALRADDGRETLLPAYVPGTLPGQFRPAGPQLVGRLNPYIRPFATHHHAQFRPGPPPALDSASYAADLNEVKSIAGTPGTQRTAEQDEVARFYTEPPPSWNWRNRARFATASPSLVDNARLTAMLEVTIVDAIAACFDAKYAYNFWRPMSAIRLANTDSNPATEADPRWTPFVSTPNHPEYPAAHSCNDGAIAELVRGFYGTQRVNFGFDSTVTGTTRQYQGTDDLVHDVSNGRVWGGMHFRNSTRVGAELGKEIARWVAKRHFQPRAGASASASSSGHPVVIGHRPIRSGFDDMPDASLKAFFIGCSREAARSMLSLDEGAMCAVAQDVLKARSFGGNFDALLAWWRAHRDDPVDR